VIWIKAVYEPAALFSYRVPGHSSQYATASPLPGPSTIKLGLVSTAIETSGSLDEGRRIFGIVKASEVRIAPPRAIAISNVILRRLKAQHDKRGTCSICHQQKTVWRAGGRDYCKEHLPFRDFDETVTQRGYVHFSGPLTIYLGVGKQP